MTGGPVVTPRPAQAKVIAWLAMGVSWFAACLTACVIGIRIASRRWPQ